jgi:GT2 family glycosyltransferase
VPNLSIVIPTHGRSESLPEVISALGRQDPPLIDAEVVVAIDARGSDPGGLDAAGPGLPVAVIHASGAGASGARNAGWRATKSPLTLFLDDDIVPSRRLVAEHLAWHERHANFEVGILGRVRWSPRVKVTPFMRWLETGVQFDYDRITGTDVGWQLFYSCNVSVKRAMLERVGGFDEERFPFGYEDLDVARRMSEHGFRLLYNRSAVGEHLKTETLESWRQKLDRIAVAERRFVQLYPDERPYFYERFGAAARLPQAQGRSARLARFVGPGVPWLGRFVWQSFDLVCAQQLAPDFLSSWEAAGRDSELPHVPGTAGGDG